ncbi:dolichyl pyrophosphate man9 c2 alpha-glucosyltransferase-like, partial [Nannochloropsis oceanica]
RLNGAYNSVCLGLALLGAAFILRGREVLGSVLFCLALNFKHIALYYAMAFFVFLLRRCLSAPLPFLRVLLLGLSVLSTFAVLWLPFCLESDEGCVAGLGHVLRRLFPPQARPLRGQGVLGAFSMFPLLERDGLASPYWATLLLHSVTNYLLVSSLPSSAPSSIQPSSITSLRDRVERFCRASPHARLKQAFVGATTLIMLLLHLLAASLPPPPRYPHLWPLLFSVFSAACLGVLLLYMNIRQWLVR